MTKPQSEVSDEPLQWPLAEWSTLGHPPSLLGTDSARLNELILNLRALLRVYLLARLWPRLKDQADELLQEFAEDKILKKGWLAKADRKRGRFRDFLRFNLENLVRDRLRGIPNAPLSLEELELDPPAEASGTWAFGLEWMRNILADLLKRMEQDCKTPQKHEPNRAQIWEIFRPRLEENVGALDVPLINEQLRSLDAASLTGVPAGVRNH